MRFISSALKNPIAQATVLAMEDVSDGKIFKEHEHVFYVKISDFDQLNRASSVDYQEQWTLKVKKSDNNQASGNIRIRKVVGLKSYADRTPKEDAQYVLTSKAEMPDGSRLEVPIPATEDAFTIFRSLAEGGMIKHRYHFPVHGTKLTFEVDMYLNPEGGYHPWAKVDLEVYDIDAAIPDLPLVVDEKICGNTTNTIEKEKITKLYDEYFITKSSSEQK